MAFDMATVESLAPDQASLTAAAKLAKPAKWLTLAREADLWWGECQGSGANPYRAVVDTATNGYKCTCPSRKFPCKHSLALMWLVARDPKTFGDGATPQWVNDWMGRRRTPAAAAAGKPKPARSIDAATSAVATDAATADAATTEVTEDPAALARKDAADRKRREDTLAMLTDGLDDLDQWVSDQLASGLMAFIDTAPARCRKIAARLVDNKAQGMASRLDELPSRLLALPAEERPDAAIRELGKLVLLARAWRADPDDPQAARDVGMAERRDDVLASPDARRVSGRWEVVGEQLRHRRDGLISHSTWFLRIAGSDPASTGAGAAAGVLRHRVPESDEERDPLSEDVSPRDQALVRQGELGSDERFLSRPEDSRRSSGHETCPFALLLDFFPASAGRPASSFTAGAQYDATMVFYPSRAPLRAFALDLTPVAATGVSPWPVSEDADPLARVVDYAGIVPWQLEYPLLLPAGRVVAAGDRLWWRAEAGASLPLAAGTLTKCMPQLLGIPLRAATGVWDGARLTFLSAETPLGKGHFT